MQSIVHAMTMGARKCRNNASKITHLQRHNTPVKEVHSYHSFTCRRELAIKMCKAMEYTQAINCTKTRHHKNL